MNKKVIYSAIALFLLANIVIVSIIASRGKSSGDQGGESIINGDIDPKTAEILGGYAEQKSSDKNSSKAEQKIEPLVLIAVSATSPSFSRPHVQLEFNRNADLESLRKGLTFTPTVDFELEERDGWNKNYYIATGNFEPGRKYVLTVARGTRGSGSRNSFSMAAMNAEVNIPDIEPEVEFPASGRYLAPLGEKIIPVRAVNVEKISFSIERLLPQNILQFIMRDNDRYKGFYSRNDESNLDGISRNAVKFDLNINDGKKNKEINIPVSLKKHLADYQYGTFLIRAGFKSNPNSGHAETRHSLVCLTDIGISARLDSESANIWITSLTSGEARAGVTVALFSDKNEVIGSAVSGKSGYVRIPFADDMDPVAVIVHDQKSGDVSFLPLTDKGQIQQTAKTTRRFITGADCEAFIFTDRGIYRPGETVFIQGILRRGDFNAPPQFPTVLEITGPDGKKAEQISVTHLEDGSFSHAFTVNESMRTGTYRIRLSTPGENGTVLGTKSVSVESFVPPQVKVLFNDIPASVPFGVTSLKARIASEYLFGGKASGLAFEGIAFPSAGEFAPEGWRGFTFCKVFDAKNAFSPIRAEAKKLDENGEAVAEFDVTPVLKSQSPVKLTVQATVTENGGRTVSETRNVIVHPRPYYLGISLNGEDSFTTDKPVEIFWTALDPEGKVTAPEGAVHAELYRVERDWECIETENGKYIWKCETELVPVNRKIPVGEINESGMGRFSVSPHRWGVYRVVLSDETGAISTAAEFDTWGWDSDSGRNNLEPEALTKVKITFDKNEYIPGDTARIRVESPFDGDLWILMHNKKVLTSYTFPLRNKAIDFAMKINETLAPNIEVSATVVRPTKVEEVWQPHRASGTASLNVRPVSHELKAKVRCRTEIKPQEKLIGYVEVTDFHGRPLHSGTATVFAVDDGICRLTGHSVPDPAAFFRAPRNSGLDYYDIYSGLMQVTDESLTGFVSHTGGDEPAQAEALQKRLSPIKARRFKTVALRMVNIPVVNGKAYFAFDIPEFSGTLKVMAVAWNSRATGSAEDFVKVRRDVVLEADMARFLAPGDSSVITLSVFNTSETEKTVEYSVSATDSVVVLPGKNNGSCVLPPNGSRKVFVPVVARNTSGVASISIGVKSGTDQFTDEIELPVRPGVALQTLASSLVIAPSNSCRVSAADGFITETLNQEFAFLAFPACDVRNALLYLTEYPYGCLEQTTSRAFPFLKAKQLPKGYLPESETIRADDYIRSAVARISLMARSGGFAMWPDSLKVNPFATLYAVHFLAEAKRAGYDTGIDADDLKRIMRNNLSTYTGYASCYAHLNLALLGEPDFAGMAALLQNSKLNNEALAILARAHIVGGQPAKGREILTKKVSKPANLRDAAFILCAWSEVNPNSIECLDAVKVINRYIDQNRRHWGTTQDNAIAVFALSSYMATRTTQNMYDKASAKIEVLNPSGNGNDTIVFPESAESSWKVPVADNGASFIVSNTGKSTLFVNHLVSGIPLKEPVPQNRGIKVERHYYTTEGKESPLSAFRRGDLVAVQIVAKFNNQYADVVIDDLLPACLEVERGNVAAIKIYPWMTEQGDWVIHSEIRDDRVLLFTGDIKEGAICTWYYLARVVSPGTFAVPAITASAMYDPNSFSIGKSSTVTVK